MIIPHDPNGPVLVAETEPLIALDIESALRLAGFDVVGPFVTPAELAAYPGNGVAGMVVNSGMLGSDLETALNAVVGGAVPVVVISARDGPVASVNRPATQILPKPIFIRHLLEKLRAAVASAT